MKAIKWTLSVSLVMILIVGCLSFVTGTVNADSVVPVDTVPEVSQEEINKQREIVAKCDEEEAKIRERYLNSEEEIQYYAYLDMSTAEEELKPIILVARNTIIYRYSWVADGMNGKVLDREGNIKRIIPEFSELFPEDWEMPVSQAKSVDLSYYAAPNK